MSSENRKKISVITTTFNLIKGGRKDVFIEMFKSVHSQTYPNIEHLIIDGGSKDGTIEFINEVNQKYGKKQLVIFSESDKGITDATIKGFHKSTGDYVILMPSDDYYMRDDALMLLADAMESENADFACSDGWWLFKARWQVDLNSFTYRHPFMISTMLSKRELFEKYGYFDPELKLVADYDLMFRILMQPDVKGTVVNEMLTVLRPGGASQQKEKLLIKETFAIYKKYFNPKCRLENDEYRVLHWQYPSNELFEKIYKNEKNERILMSVKQLESYKDIIPHRDIIKYDRKKRVRKIIWNIMFLKFIFRPIKRFLGIKKEEKTDFSENNIHSFFVPQKGRNMKYEIPEADVYSFDIFDTLITRKTALPCGIFRLIQEKLENGVGTFSADFIKNFFQIRAHIENFIRINFSASQIKQDLSFDDIYQRMASNYHLTKDEREYLQKIELETEIENTIPIQENIEYLKSKYKEGKKIILISDMYLPAETLKKILLSFDSVFQNIPVYVSGDIGASKYYGDLFDAVAFKEKITDRKKWIHIGDNKYADVKVPESKGIRTWHFNYPDLKPYEAEYIYNNPTDTAAQFLIGQSRLSRLFSSDKSEAFDIAVSYAAPLLYQYVDFIVKETLHRGIRNLYFLARDGFILKIIADEIIKIRNLKIRTHYFYGSRKSLRCPNKDRIEDFLKTSLMETEVLLSVKDKKFFQIFSLFSNIPKSLLEKFFLNGKELKKNILSADFQQACLAYFEKKADLVQRYIKQEVLTDESFAFVDLEGSGRTVNLLAQNMGRSFPCFYYMLVPPAKCFDAFEPIVFSHRVEAYAQPLELLCRHFEGQCLGYHEEGNKIVPVLDTDMKEDFQKCSWDNYLYGIETFTKRFSRFVAEDIITFIPSFPLAWRYFDWLCNSPNKKMADFLGEIPYTNLGAEKNKKAAPPFSINSRLKFLEKQRKGKQSEFTCFPFLSIARTPRSIMRISDAINLTVNFISRLLFVEKSEERKKIYVFGIRILSVKRRKCCV